jgi:hypothetical protein
LFDSFEDFTRSVILLWLERARILRQMDMRVFVLLLLLFAFPCSTRAQSKPQSSAAGQAITQQSGSNAETYSDTLAMIKAWRETEESDELGRLFAIGDLRTSDLSVACNDADEEIASFAFLVLHLLGKSECVPCSDTISRKHNGVPFVCGVNIADTDFNRIERWLAKKKNGNGYECAPEGEYEPLTPLADSVVYALILDGSPRSRSILNHMDAIENACGVEHSTIIGGILEQTQSLIAAAKRSARNLKFEPDTLESVVRSSAFFLPSKYRKDSQIEVIARNVANDRILLEVSYRCGRLCGSGYYVVLQKDGTAWRYASIGMAWIS